MSTHNICFCEKIRKILCGYPLLSIALEWMCCGVCVLFINSIDLLFINYNDLCSR